MLTPDSFANRQGRNGLGIRAYVCHTCGMVLDGMEDPVLPMFPECNNECCITPALVCAGRPRDEGRDDIQETFVPG